jgi:hypothetical protein
MFTSFRSNTDIASSYRGYFIDAFGEAFGEKGSWATSSGKEIEFSYVIENALTATDKDRITEIAKVACVDNRRYLQSMEMRDVRHVNETGAVVWAGVAVKFVVSTDFNLSIDATVNPSAVIFNEFAADYAELKASTIALDRAKRSAMKETDADKYIAMRANFNVWLRELEHNSDSAANYVEVESAKQFWTNFQAIAMVIVFTAMRGENSFMKVDGYPLTSAQVKRSINFALYGK